MAPPITSIILDVIVIIIILSVAALIFVFFLGNASAPICTVSSFFRNFVQSSCFKIVGAQVICINDYFNWQSPLLGCGPTSYDVASDKIETEIGITSAMCYQKYGEGKWDLFYFDGENPAICNTLRTNVGEEGLTAKDIVDKLEDTVFRDVVDCTTCTNPCLTDGYSCNRASPALCEKTSTDPIKCQQQSGSFGYYPCDSGETLHAFQTESECIADILENDPDELCFDGFYYDEEKGVCISYYSQEEMDIVLRKELTLETPGCGYCVDTETKSISIPKSCILYEDANPECRVQETLADYLEPEEILLISMKKSGEDGILVKPDDEDVKLTGEVRVFVEFIDSFSSTKKPPAIRVLPPECAKQYFLDSCGIGCTAECAVAVLEYYGGVRAVGLFDIGLKTGGRYSYTGDLGWALSNALVNNAFVKCAECVGNSIAGLGVDLAICKDTIMVCAYEVN